MEQILEKPLTSHTPEWVIESDETIALLDAAFASSETVSHEEIMNTLIVYSFPSITPSY
jgi:hypothetical protein